MFGYKVSTFFHCKESVGCWIFPSHFVSLTCHLIFFASFKFTNNCLNLGMVGRYHNTFAKGHFVVTSEPSSSLFFLYHDVIHLGHFSFSSLSFQYNMQSFGHSCIFLYSIPFGHNFFFASYASTTCFHLEAFPSTTLANV